MLHGEQSGFTALVKDSPVDTIFKTAKFPVLMLSTILVLSAIRQDIREFLLSHYSVPILHSLGYVPASSPQHMHAKAILSDIILFSLDIAGRHSRKVRAIRDQILEAAEWHRSVALERKRDELRVRLGNEVLETSRRDLNRPDDLTSSASGEWLESRACGTGAVSLTWWHQGDEKR